MKVYLVLYHDRWAHSECESGCCCVQTTSISAVRLTMKDAEDWITDYITKWRRPHNEEEMMDYKREYEVEEMDTEERGD